MDYGTLNLRAKAIYAASIITRRTPNFGYGIHFEGDDLILTPFEVRHSKKMLYESGRITVTRTEVKGDDFSSVSQLLNIIKNLKSIAEDIKKSKERNIAATVEDAVISTEEEWRADTDSIEPTNQNDWHSNYDYE